MFGEDISRHKRDGADNNSDGVQQNTSPTHDRAAAPGAVPKPNAGFPNAQAAEFEPVWVRLSLEYGRDTPENPRSQVIYSSVSENESDTAERAVADSIVELIRKAQQMHTDMSQEEDSERVDELAKTLQHDELTFEKLSQMWADAPSGGAVPRIGKQGAEEPDSSSGGTDGFEELTQPIRDADFPAETPESDSATHLSFEHIIDANQQDEVYRRRALARGITHREMVRQLVELTAERNELVAYELGRERMQVYLLCAADKSGYLNVLHVQPTGSGYGVTVGEPAEDYVAWLVEQLPVTGAALESSPTVWMPVFGGADELEFLANGAAAALLDIDIDTLTGLLLTRQGREFTIAPAGTWTLVSAQPEDILSLIDDVQCTALIAEGNENQQHLTLIIPPEDTTAADASDFSSPSEWMRSVLGAPTQAEPVIVELRWQEIPKRLTRTLAQEELDTELEDILLSIPGMPLASEQVREANERSIEVLTELFDLNAQQNRRLAAYVHNNDNTLAMESVLQLLGLPVELAAVPTRGFDISSVGRGRVFEPDSEVASPLDRSYRLVVTGRKVSLQQWLDAMATGSIPHKFTHLPTDATEPLAGTVPGSGRSSIRAGGKAHIVDSLESSGNESVPSTGKETEEDKLYPWILTDGTVQLGLSAFFIALARRRRAMGRGTTWQMAAASLLALTGATEVLFAPRLARLLHRIARPRSPKSPSQTLHSTPPERAEPGIRDTSRSLGRGTFIDELTGYSEGARRYSPHTKWGLRERIRRAGKKFFGK